jgi:hypothetical protein
VAAAVVAYDVLAHAVTGAVHIVTPLDAARRVPPYFAVAFDNKIAGALCGEALLPQPPLLPHQYRGDRCAQVPAGLNVGLVRLA